MTSFRCSSLAFLLLFSALLSAEAVKLSGRATGAGPLAKCKVCETEREREREEERERGTTERVVQLNRPSLLRPAPALSALLPCFPLLRAATIFNSLRERA